MKAFKFKNWEFAIFVSNFILMLLLVLVFGNPKIPNTHLYWHHIPELTATYFIGCWVALNKVPLSIVLIIFLLSGFLTPVFVGRLSNASLIFSTIIALPFPLGFLVWRKIEG